MTNFVYRTEFTLTLSPGQTIAGYFETHLNNDNTPVDYQFGGGFAAKTFAQTYTTIEEAQEAIDAAFQPLQQLIQDLNRAALLTAPPRVTTKTYDLLFPNAGGDLTGTVRLDHDTGAADISQVLFVLGGAAMTMKRATVQDALQAMAPLDGLKEKLFAHARLDV
jgi:hypothetical protein